MAESKPRIIAICVFSREGSVLATHGADPATGNRFYRPIGGEIEFGETGSQAVAREVGEELGLRTADVRFIGVLENIFQYDNRTGHEVVLVYDGRLEPEPAIEATLVVRSAPEPDRVASWLRLDRFGERFGPLYPSGLGDLLARAAVAPRE